MIRAIILSAILLYQSAGVVTIHRPPRRVVAAEEETERSGCHLMELTRYGNGHCELVKFDGACQVIKVRIYDRNGTGYNNADGKLFLQDLIDLCEGIDLGGIPLEAMLAQAYTEGGAGKQGVYKKSNNLFGIRAGANWDGYVYSRDLKKLFTDFRSAVAAGGRDLFRAYDDMEDSIRDYVDLVHSSALYKGALGKSPKRYLKHLVEHGYGNPAMVDIWLNVIKIYHLKGEH